MAKQELTFFSTDLLMEILGSKYSGLPTNYVCRDFAVLMDGQPKVFQRFFKLNTPYIIERSRLGLIYQGEVDVELNLTRHHIQAPSLLFVQDKSLVEFLHYPEDIRVAFLAPSNEFLSRIYGGRIPESFIDIDKDFTFRVSEADARFILGIISQIIQLGPKPGFQHVTETLFLAVLNYYDALIQAERHRHPESMSRESEIFKQFIRLVREHCRQHRDLSFYADKMCLTQRYLSSMVRQASGSPAKVWIDKAVISEAQVMLRQSDLPAARISELLSFPNPSFFSKYFCNHVGMTPLEYRKR